MTRMNNAMKFTTHALSWVLSLVVMVAICFSCIAMAAEADTFEQTLHVKQSIVSGEAQKTKYTYKLVPITENAPLPAEAKAGADSYEFDMDGNAKVDLKLYFTADVAADYKYELRREGTVPAGDTVTPDVHIFGYLVEKDDNGEWVIIPYTCYNNEFKISTDENGNPTGVTLSNNIKGKPTTTTSTTTTTKRSTTTTTRKGYSYSTRTVTRTNVVTNTVARVVNTGDPYQVGLWVILIVLSLAALIILAAVRRRKEKDEEDS